MRAPVSASKLPRMCTEPSSQFQNRTWRSRMGRWWFSMRHSERATAAMGRSVVVTNISAFAVSAAIAGVGGALLTGLFAHLVPNFLSDIGLPRDIAPILFAAGSDGIVLEIRQVSVSYSAVKVLDDVSLSVPEGGVFGLIGPNGAGKSTLVDALSGFTTSHAGRFLLDGDDITALPPRQRARRGLRRTFQQGHTPRDLTVGGYLDLCVTRQSTSVAEALDCRTRLRQIDRNWFAPGCAR